MIFHRRSRAGPDPHLHGKMGLFGLGAVLGLMGIGLESSVLVGAGILALAGGLALRVWGDRKRARASRNGPDDTDEAEDTDQADGTDQADDTDQGEDTDGTDDVVDPSDSGHS